MTRVSLDSSNHNNRNIADAVLRAVRELDLRSHRLPWQSRLPIEIHATPMTFAAVGDAGEFRPWGKTMKITPGGTLFGLTVVFDLGQQPGTLKIVDPRTLLSETVELV